MSNLGKKNGGFSAIELLVMIIILAITFTGFVSGYNLITQANKKSQNMNTASNLAISKLQEYQNKRYEDINASSGFGETTIVENFGSEFPASFNAPKTATVSVSNQSSDSKQIIVNVVYGNGDQKRKISYIDFIRRAE